MADLKSRIRDFDNLDPSRFVNNSPPAAIMHKLYDAKRLIAELHILAKPPLTETKSKNA